MAAATLAVAIVGAATGIGSLAWSCVSWRRTGWNLDVDLWWDFHGQLVHVEIVNTGRQECVLSEIRYFVEDLTESRGPWSEWVIFDSEDLPGPIAPSAKVEITKDFTLPSAFSLEVWVWTGGRPYKSKRWTGQPPLRHPIER